MISICIPIHNYYVYPLVRRLANQIHHLGFAGQVELVCIDNHSSGYYLNQNMGVCDIATYLQLSENIGRMRIRNLFLKYTKGDWLLFLDDTSKLPETFMETYMKYVDGKEDVIVGGRDYDRRDNDREHRLCYLHGTNQESRPAEERAVKPYQSFMTNNFMIRRNVLERIKIDPRLCEYGHEDTLLGYHLAVDNVDILHIDNPVVNGDVETNAEFLKKTVKAVENLVDIYKLMWEDQRFCQTVRLIDLYGQVRRRGMENPFYNLFKLLKAPTENLLAKGNVKSLKLFNFYKIGIFIQKLHHDTDGNESSISK